MRLGEGPGSHTRNLSPRRLIQYSAGNGKRGVRRSRPQRALCGRGQTLHSRRAIPEIYLLCQSYLYLFGSAQIFNWSFHSA
jgi:hypothetical protein